MSFHPRRRWTAWQRWPDLEAGPYWVGLTWSGAEGGRVKLVGFEVWTRPPGDERVDEGPAGSLLDDLTDTPELTSRLLHDFPLATIANTTRAQLVEAYDDEDGTEDLVERDVGGRYGREHFRAVAAEYRKAFAEGLDPLEHVARHFAISRSTASHWVSRARHDFKFLPLTTRGRAAV